jgi:hypothetical protein
MVNPLNVIVIWSSLFAVLLWLVVARKVSYEPLTVEFELLAVAPLLSPRVSEVGAGYNPLDPGPVVLPSAL